MNKPVSKMTTEELRDLKRDIRNREQDIENEAKKIIWEVSNGHCIQGAYKEEELEKALNEVIRVIEVLKEETERDKQDETLSQTDKKEAMIRGLPKIRAIYKHISDYESEFND